MVAINYDAYKSSLLLQASNISSIITHCTLGAAFCKVVLSLKIEWYQAPSYFEYYDLLQESHSFGQGLLMKSEEGDFERSSFEISEDQCYQVQVLPLFLGSVSTF